MQSWQHIVVSSVKLHFNECTCVTTTKMDKNSLQHFSNLTQTSCTLKWCQILDQTMVWQQLCKNIHKSTGWYYYNNWSKCHTMPQVMKLKWIKHNNVNTYRTCFSYRILLIYYYVTKQMLYYVIVKYYVTRTVNIVNSFVCICLIKNNCALARL